MISKSLSGVSFSKNGLDGIIRADPFFFLRRKEGKSPIFLTYEEERYVVRTKNLKIFQTFKVKPNTKKGRIDLEFAINVFNFHVFKE